MQFYFPFQVIFRYPIYYNEVSDVHYFYRRRDIVLMTGWS